MFKNLFWSLFSSGCFIAQGVCSLKLYRYIIIAGICQETYLCFLKSNIFKITVRLTIKCLLLQICKVLWYRPQVFMCFKIEGYSKPFLPFDCIQIQSIGSVVCESLRKFTFSFEFACYATSVLWLRGLNGKGKYCIFLVFVQVFLCRDKDKVHFSSFMLLKLLAKSLLNIEYHWMLSRKI